MATQREERSTAVVASNDVRWLLIQRILGSALFQRSVRLRQFLSFVAEHAVLHPDVTLTEHQIGCAVFGRPETYSTAEDNIVRVHARQLRARLEEYFAGPGVADSLVCEIPKGSYVPIFGPRADPKVEASVAVALAVPLTGTRSWNLTTLAMIVLSALGCGYWLRGVAPVSALPPPSWLLDRVFTSGKAARMVVPDSSFGLLQGFLGRNLGLNDYLKPGYPDSLGWPVQLGEAYVERAKAVASRPYATYSEVVMSARLAAEAERRGWQMTVAHPRSLTVRDLNQGNFLLLGSPRSNPWTAIYEAGMNFQSTNLPAGGRGGIKNLAPVLGESSLYLPDAANGFPGEVYALVSLHALKSGTILTLAGTNMEGTEAAWDFVYSVEQGETLLRRLRMAEAPKKNFILEVVLRSHALAGAPRDTTIVATRFRQQ